VAVLQAHGLVRVQGQQPTSECRSMAREATAASSVRVVSSSVFLGCGTLSSSDEVTLTANRHVGWKQHVPLSARPGWKLGGARLAGFLLV